YPLRRARGSRSRSSGRATRAWQKSLADAAYRASLVGRGRCDNGGGGGYFHRLSSGGERCREWVKTTARRKKTVTRSGKISHRSRSRSLRNASPFSPRRSLGSRQRSPASRARAAWPTSSSRSRELRYARSALHSWGRLRLRRARQWGQPDISGGCKLFKILRPC